MRSIVIVLAFYAFCGTTISALPLVINEFVAANESGAIDKDGGYSDWIELYNSSTTPLNLSGYAISDRPDFALAWKFPGVTIDANGFLRLWASGKNIVTGAELHTDFGLKSDGEQLFLWDAAGTLLDSLTFLAQVTNGAFGRYPDGVGPFCRLTSTTAGIGNSLPYTQTTAALPVFSVPSGLRFAAFSVTLTQPNGGTIRYTTNGSDPTVSSTIYSSAIAVSVTTIIKAMAFESGKSASPIVTRQYLFNITHSLPVLAIATDPKNFYDNTTGIYVHYTDTGMAAERPLHVAFFENDNTLGFESEAGVRIHGGTTRSMSKKSLRVYFRPDYGISPLTYKIFDRKDVPLVSRFIVRSGGPEPLLFRDALAGDLGRELGLPMSTYRWVLVYLNGQPFGLCDLREHVNGEYIESQYGINEDHLDLIKFASSRGGLEVKDGSLMGWNAAQTFFNATSCSTATAYESARQLVDIQNYTDEHILKIFAADNDWPQKNAFTFRDALHATPFKFGIWDCDYAFGGFNSAWDHNTLAWASRSGARPDLAPPYMVTYSEMNMASTIIFRRLLENPDYRAYFITRSCDVMNTTLESSKLRRQIDTIANQLRPDYGYEAQLWNKDVALWNRQVDTLKMWCVPRAGYVRKHIAAQFAEVESVGVVVVNQPSGGEGSIHINTVDVPAFPFTGYYFRELPITVTATGSVGYRFKSWGNAAVSDTSHILSLRLSADITLNPVFESGAQPVEYQTYPPAHFLSMKYVANSRTLLINAAGKGAVACALFALNGKRLMAQDFLTENGSVSIALDRWSTPAGVYLVQIRQGKRHLHGRIVFN